MVGDVTGETPQTRAVEQLQQLGLKQYEAKCFVSLAKLSSGTARDISDHVDVPRTRVYEAVRVLEKEGLVEVQHSSPQRFRAIPIAEAVDILRTRYESRIESLADALEEVGSGDSDADEGERLEQEVWSLSDAGSISTRTQELVGEAGDTIALIVGSEEVLSDGLIECLEDASDRGVDVTVGAVSEKLTDRLRSALSDARVFESELYWLQGTAEDDALVGRLLLVDDSTILASTVTPHGGSRDERAIYGRGFGNSIVVIVRRLIATGLRLEA